ncbi:cytochrome ubiquinol oxidase subunit I, partial [Proteus terrae]|nr:cytochrome ubiquinol oxidase subunit I [Proteus terrae]
MLEVKNTQPMKFSATEGVYETTEDPAAWDMIAFFNEADHKSVFGVRIPYVLSILTYHRPSGSVEGMNQINKELEAKYGDHLNYYPPVTVLFYTFRIMAGLSMYFMLISALGLFWTRRKKPWMYEKPGMMRLYGWSMFLPFLAITSGWLVTELGRYPWTVYG